MSLGVAGALCGLLLTGAGALGVSTVAGAATLTLLEQASAAAVSNTRQPTVGSSGQPSIQAASPAIGAGGMVEIPSEMVGLYKQAAEAACPGLPWTVLAAIGTVESGNGISTMPGVHSGSNYAGAQGPMQFEPATFAAYDRPVPPGGASPPSPYDPTDAVYAAARMLCANGAASAAGLPGAVFAYNHASWYVEEVLSLASLYQSQDQ